MPPLGIHPVAMLLYWRVSTEAGKEGGERILTSRACRSSSVSHDISQNASDPGCAAADIIRRSVSLLSLATADAYGADPDGWS